MLAAHEQVAYRNIEVTPTLAAIGALVERGHVTIMNAATFDELQHAFLDNLVILIRGRGPSIRSSASILRRAAQSAVSSERLIEESISSCLVHASKTRGRSAVRRA